jgi:nicotinamide riboside kinase
MLITLTGAQSSGKSTLLAAMQSDPEYKDWNFEPEITRSLKAKYGFALDEVSDDATQIVTIYSHLDNYLRNKDKNTVLDRCSIDALVYTTYFHYKKDAKVSQDIGFFAEKVHSILRSKYDIIFYTDPSIPLADDGVRSTNIEYRNKIIELFELLFKNDATLPKPMNVVRLTGSVEERLSQIKKSIDFYKSCNIITP